MTAPAASTLRALPGHPAALFGFGAVDEVPRLLDEWDAARVLVVTGGASYATSGCAAAIERASTTRRVEVFGGVRPNPTVPSVVAAATAVRRSGADVVVGVGGGSAMDTAKVAACLADDPHPRAVLTPAADRRRAIRLLLVPTVAGSGAELTRFATVYDGERKLSFAGADCRADAVVVDPALVATVPQAYAATAALDALCQAVESYWSIRADDASRAWSAAALDALLRGTTAALDGAGFGVAQQAVDVSWGAAVAGAAIDRARTTAAHALSYPLTARRGVPHGVAVGLHLPWLAARNGETSDGECRHPGGARLVRRLVADLEGACVAATGRPLAGVVARLLAAAGGPARLADLGLDPDEWRPAVDAALASDRAANNPRALDAASALDLLRKGG